MEVQLRLWARMIENGVHASKEFPSQSHVDKHQVSRAPGTL